MEKKKKINSNLRNKDIVTGYLFIVPSFFGFIAFSLFPLVMTLGISLSEWNLVSGLKGIHFIGIENYTEMLSDPVFYESLKNNILFTLWSLPALLVFGLLGAVMINACIRGKKFLKVLFFLPYISSTVAIATVWRVIFQPNYGPVNQFLISIGMSAPPRWLTDPKWALFIITVMFIWQNLGYYVLLYTTAITGIPEDLYEAAEIDGAGKFNQLINITLPMVTPTTFFLSITGIIASFKVFDAIQVLTQGGPGSSTSVLVHYLYKVSFEFNKVGYGSTIAMSLFVVVFIITIVQWQGQKKWVNY